MEQKKRHHYVPKAYLRAFGDQFGRIRVYRKDEPTKPLHVNHDGAAVRRYYYSQPTPDGAIDHNRLEDLFSSIEDKWPPLVKRLERQDDVNDSLLDLLTFTALQRVRVPAARDATEARLAAGVMRDLQRLKANGILPAPPLEFPDLLERVQVSTDPHQSIHGMAVDLSEQVSRVFNRVGFAAIHNHSSRPFLTSDNPVVWFDPTVLYERERPYQFEEDGKVMLLFPLTPRLLLMGSSDNKEFFSKFGVQYGTAPDAAWVARINEQVCRYAYEAVFASALGQEDLIQSHAALSPVYDSSVGGLVFGPRVRLPKWERKTC
jgi:hypothetical protein